MFRPCIALLLALATLPAFSADEPDIRELMTAEEFAASGLSRLSDEEFEVVNRWLLRFSSQQAEEESLELFGTPAATTDTIVSRIDGEFTGLNGPARFTLKNGQVWETKSTRRFSYIATDPEVEITRNWLGSHRMHILGSGKSIAVKRVQ